MQCHDQPHTSQRIKIIKQTCSAKLSAFSSLSMMRRAVTITVGSFLTVLRVLLSTRRSCFSNSCDSTSTSSKYALSIILSAGAWFGSLCSSCSRSSRAFSRSVRLWKFKLLNSNHVWQNWKSYSRVSYKLFLQNQTCWEKTKVHIQHYYTYAEFCRWMAKTSPQFTTSSLMHHKISSLFSILEKNTCLQLECKIYGPNQCFWTFSAPVGQLLINMQSMLHLFCRLSVSKVI